MTLVVAVGIELVEHVKPDTRFHPCRFIIIVDSSCLLRSPMIAEATRLLCGLDNSSFPGINTGGVAKNFNSNSILRKLGASSIFSCSNDVA